MSLLLVVASLTLSHVTAIVFKVDEADDVSWSSMAMEQILGGGSFWQMPAKSERLGASSCDRAARAAVAAMSSDKTSRSSLVVPVGWRETASAPLCRTPGMCTNWKW